MPRGLTPKITIVDYGLSNLFSVEHAFKHLGARVVVSSDPKEILKAEKLVIPGVAVFGEAMFQLSRRQLVEPILKHIRSGRFLLGICLGMQILFTFGEEFGLHEGLGVFQGKVVPLRPEASRGYEHYKIPNIGWHCLMIPSSRKTWTGTLLEDLEPQEALYFIHSFVPVFEEPSIVVAQMQWGERCYGVALQKENIFGVQFHPEKSGKQGLQILNRFLDL